MEVRDLPGNLWEIVLWANKPVWYKGHIVYPDPIAIPQVSVCDEAEWKRRGERLVLVVWSDGKLLFPTAE